MMKNNNLIDMTFNIQQEFISGSIEITTLFSDTYGHRTYMKGGGGSLYDPSWDMFRAYVEIKLGVFFAEQVQLFFQRQQKVYQLGWVALKQH